MKSCSYITNITLPAIKNVPYPYGDPPRPQPLPIMIAEEAPIAGLEEEVMPQVMEAQEPEEVVSPQIKVGQAAKTGGGDGQSRRDLLSMYYMPMRPNVESLLLHKDKLVVIASGYGQSLRNELEYTPTINEAHETNVRVYDVSKLEKDKEPPLLKTTDINGRFDSARADNNNAHLVTFSSINTYSFLDQPLSRHLAQFQNMSDDEYKTASKGLAENKLIPAFVDQRMKDLSVNGKPADIARISMWHKHLSDTDSKLEDILFEQGIMNAYAQVTSLDMGTPSQVLAASDEMNMSASGTVMPTSWGHTYATNKMLVIAGQGWDWIASQGASVETTYLHGFALQGSHTKPAAVGSLEGSLLNEYAVDIVDNHVRVAITIRNNMWRFDDTSPVELPPTQNFIKVLEIPELDDNGAVVGSPIMKEVGSSESFGEPRETFQGVRFSDKVAYVITFERTDPLYVVSFENPTQPKTVGELKKTGFSRYLHFINEANTLLLGVGQEADENGRPIGLQVTLYDATDPANPKDVDHFDYILDPDVRASSSAEFDFKAFRYVSLEDEKGILIIPMRLDSITSTEGNFDGFVLLDVDNKRISERFSIPHVDSAAFRLGCFRSERLADRSFVVKGHSIQKYNLDSHKPVSEGINLDQDMDTTYAPCVMW